MKLKWFLLLGIMSVILSQGFAQKNQQTNVRHTFALSDSSFVLDGKPFVIISGEMHYPRVPREAWRQRMKMAKAMGLNTIGTYVFWNLHEPQKGKFDFTGNNDVAEFVKIAKEEGLWVILRPSPYVCAEWEFGGYPYWLQNEKGLIVRSKESQYLKEYQDYIKEVGKQLAPFQINHGGNVLMVQVENEYGSFDSDKEYLTINEKMFKEAGFDGLLYTCDPAADIAKGHLPGLLPAVNGLDDPAKVKGLIKGLNKDKGPFFIAEWYPAWFDWWGAAHHTVPASEYTGKLDSVLNAGISINMYMFHGGTTRGFMNGANFKDTSPYEPQTSSYDYDAPLDEAGNATDKFMKFREVIQKHLPEGISLPVVPEAKPTIAIDKISFRSGVSVATLLKMPVKNAKPLSFEDLNQDYGFVWYRTVIDGGKTGILKLNKLRDYAVVMVNGKRIATLDRRLNEDSLSLSLPAGKVKLDILVENLGRINFGKYLLQNKKGITESVFFAGKEVRNWEMFSLPFEHNQGIQFKTTYKTDQSPVLRKANFSLAQVADTYLDMSTWGKGVIWLNGHNLGRYWEIGPQQTLYMPAEWLKKGTNELVVLELLKTDQHELHSLKTPVLSSIKK